MLAKRSLELLKSGIEEELFSGAGYALVSKRTPGGVGTIGRVSFDPDSMRVERDTLFDVASLTKPLATAMAVIQLINHGQLSLDSNVGSLLNQPQFDDTTVFHLLTHTSGLEAVTPESAPNPLQAALAMRPTMSPGTQYLYSDIGYILLGEIVRLVSQVNLDIWFKENIAKPLYLENSGFVPDEELTIVETDEDEDPGTVHDPRARAMGGIAGHAGLFASAADIAAYVRALLGAGKALAGNNTLAQMFSNQLPPEIGFQSLGWFCKGNPYMPDIHGFSPECIGHSGFTGCFILIDRPNQVAACLLTNRALNPEIDAPKFLDFRKQWLSAAARDLGL